ncbi:MAG: response regulator [Alphaproteobacteria bacterium]|nr:response regulator [Alphaproteobacteria bacterium]
MTKILVVDDEIDIVTLIKYNLENAGFEVCSETDGANVLHAISIEQPDLLILDWMLPNKTGIQILEELRYDDDFNTLPVIMLTARGEEADKVEGLAVGSDDYMTKPFSVVELIARIRALLRRITPLRKKENEQKIWEFDDIRMDTETCRVTRENRYVHMGPTEFCLLKILMQQPRHVFSREELLHDVWGEDIHVEVRTVDVHIRRLRRALNAGGERDLIRTIRSSGYSIDNNEIPDEE